MGGSALAEIRANVDRGKNSCLDLSLPPEKYLEKAKDFKLVFEVVEFVLKNQGDRSGAYFVSSPDPFPECKGALRRVSRNLITHMKYIQEQSGLPLIFGASYKPSYLWEPILKKLDFNRIFVVNDPSKKAKQYENELFYIFPRQHRDLGPPQPLDERRQENREERLSTDYCNLRELLGEGTILLVQERDTSQASCDDHKNGNGKLMILYHNVFLASSEAIDKFRRRTNNPLRKNNSSLKKAS